MSTRNTTIGRICVAGMAAVASVAVLLPATAQQPKDLTVEVGDCVELTAPAERLACFEAQVEAARQEHSGSGERRAAGAAEPARSAPEAEPSARAPEAAPRARTPAVEPSARPSALEPSTRPPAAEVRREPARTVDPAPSSNPRRDRGGSDPAPAEIVARVAALRETVPNSYVITLDNGQVWRQTRPMSYALKPGSEVRIYTAGRWGERLTNPELRGFIQVERVR